MSEILATVVKSISASLAAIILKLIPLAKELLRYMNLCKQEKQQEKHDKELKEYNDKVKDVCDNGTVEDLLNL